MHADTYSAKLPPAALQSLEQRGRALTQKRSSGAAGGNQNQFLCFRPGGTDVSGQCLRQLALNKLQECAFALPALGPLGEGGVGRKYLL